MASTSSIKSKARSEAKSKADEGWKRFEEGG